jgi:hypothetical protein
MTRDSLSAKAIDADCPQEICLPGLDPRRSPEGSDALELSGRVLP